MAYSKQTAVVSGIQYDAHLRLPKRNHPGMGVREWLEMDSVLGSGMGSILEWSYAESRRIGWLVERRSAKGCCVQKR